MQPNHSYIAYFIDMKTHRLIATLVINPIFVIYATFCGSFRRDLSTLLLLKLSKG